MCARGAGLWRGVDGGAAGDSGAGDRRGLARADERPAALETMTRRRRR